MKRVLLVDADILIFSVSQRNEKPVNWGNGLWTLHSYEDETSGDLDDEVEKLKEELNANEVIMVVSAPDNFRYKVMPDYKSNRKVKREPMLRQWLKQYVLSNYQCEMWDGLEGDDVLSLLSTEPHEDEERIVCSIDKDLKTVPGLFYNWTKVRHAVDRGLLKKHEDGVLKVTQEQADYWLAVQTLAGDQTDGYSGCPGIGLAGADKLLQLEPHILEEYTHTFARGKNKGQTEKRTRPLYGDYTRWETIVSYFEAAGLNEQAALDNYHVARMLRDGEYDYQTREVKLHDPR